jgi:hypothetical protein
MGYFLISRLAVAAGLQLVFAASPSSPPAPPFLGNRTHVAYSISPRSDAAKADPSFATTATGSVLIGFGDLVDGEGKGFDVVGGRGDLIQQWGKENGIQVNVSSKPRNTGM